MTYASFASIFVLLFGGIIYDLLGRRATVYLMLVIGALSTFPLPFGFLMERPAIYYTSFKVIFNCSIIPLIMNPFINDYVQVYDRGLAMGMQNLGLTCGSLLSVGGLYTLTTMLQPDTAFALLCIMQLFWVLLIMGTGMITEPAPMSQRELRKQSKKSSLGKMYSILKQVFKACKQDHALAIGLIAISFSRMGSMLQQVTFYNWIESYIGPDFSLIEAQEVW